MRVFGRRTAYKPVRRLNESRYEIDYDFVPMQDEPSLGYWSTHQYFTKPATEQVQKMVRDGTIARYIAEGLTPPEREDIDVSEYVIG